MRRPHFRPPAPNSGDTEEAHRTRRLFRPSDATGASAKARSIGARSLQSEGRARPAARPGWCPKGRMRGPHGKSYLLLFACAQRIAASPRTPSSACRHLLPAGEKRRVALALLPSSVGGRDKRRFLPPVLATGERPDFSHENCVMTLIPVPSALSSTISAGTASSRLMRRPISFCGAILPAASIDSMAS